MERTHARDIQSTALRTAIKTAREAAAMGTTGSSSTSSGLLARGGRIARSLLTSRCVSSQGIDTCQKPAASSGVVLGILVAVGVVGFFIVLGILYILHRRGKEREKHEFANDPHELSDYGLDPPSGKEGRNLGAPGAPKQNLSAQQLMEAQNPFGNGADLADSDRVASKGAPPQYPGDAHVKS